MHFNTSNSSLLQNFQSFYYELLRQKEKALRMSEPDNTFAEGFVENNLIENIQKKIKIIFEEQSFNQSKFIGSTGANQFKDAQYIMVVLTDEVFLNLNWVGAKQWEKTLLEAQIFHTQVAGDLFFKKLDALLESNEPGRGELALIYFLALSLGFLGKYRDDNNEKIKWYLNKLYTLVNHKPLHLFHPGRPHLLDQAYNFTLTELPGRGLPDLRIWTMCIVCILTVYIFFTYVVWYKLASEVHEALEMIFEQTRQSPL